MNAAEARRRFETARVARLATASADGRPHVVPITFALLPDDDVIVFAVDHKPKRTTALRRLANIRENPAVSVLVDEYSEDWGALWWVRADGVARVASEAPGREAALDALGARYEQYAGRRPPGPVMLIEVERWSGWSASDSLDVKPRGAA